MNSVSTATNSSPARRAQKSRSRALSLINGMAIRYQMSVVGCQGVGSRRRVRLEKPRGCAKSNSMRASLAVAALAAHLALAPVASSVETRFSLTGTWPNGGVVDKIEGQEVTFPSASPFSPAEFADLAEAPKATARAILFMAPGRHKDRSLPAVIMLHGSSGVQPARELTY